MSAWTDDTRPANPPAAINGDADLAAIGRVLADPGRGRMLLALGDGRALPASRLAAEAGVSAATASSHLARLTDAGLLAVEPHGRFRYYRLAGPEVGQLLETIALLAPATPVRSLRQGTQAAAIRAARTCYDHLAGRLGVEVMAALLDAGHLAGGGGRHDPDGSDPRAGHGHEVDYRVTDSGRAFFAELQVPVARKPLRYCIDWTEQRHHLSGALGRALLARLIELGWVRRAPASRAVRLTDDGRRGLLDVLDVRLTSR
ncbi:MAG: ArsR/SmtB family transcription factor [Mycobacteriales bacterium]